MQYKFNRALALTIGVSMASFGLGLGVTMSDKPFLVEVHVEPVGTFVFRGNLPDIEHFPDIPHKEKPQSNYLA